MKETYLLRGFRRSGPKQQVCVAVDANDDWASGNPGHNVARKAVEEAFGDEYCFPLCENVPSSIVVSDNLKNRILDEPELYAGCPELNIRARRKRKRG